MIQLIHGDEPFLIREHLSQLDRTHAQRSKVMLSDAVDLTELWSHLTTIDMFSPSKYILIKNPFFLTKSASDNEIKLWGQCLEEAQKNDTAVTVALIDAKADQRKKAFALLKKAAKIQEFNAFKDWEQDKVLAWIKQRVDTLGKTIDADAILALEQIGGMNLAQLAGEIDKLITYMGAENRITQNDVHALSAGVSSSTYLFTEALQNRNLKSALNSLTALLNHGEDPIGLLGLMTASIRLYLQLLLLDQDRQNTTQMGKLLGKNPYFLKRLLTTVKQRHKLPQLKQALYTLNHADTHIKSGKMQPRNAVEMALIKILT